MKIHRISVTKINILDRNNYCILYIIIKNPEELHAAFVKGYTIFRFQDVQSISKY
jgi:hypothetical protein